MPCEGADAKIPAGMRAHTLTVRERHGLVWQFWGEATDALPDVYLSVEPTVMRGVTYWSHAAPDSSRAPVLVVDYEP